MRLSPQALAQMYPHLVQVDCEAHGEQLRSNVPSHLRALFATRDDPTSVCQACLLDAKTQWADNQRDLKRKVREEKEERRASIKQAREDAITADDSLLLKINRCLESEETVKSAEQALEATRSTTAEKSKIGNNILSQITDLTLEYRAIELEVLNLSEAAAEQFEVLEQADTSVAVCYNDLKAAVDQADHLWETLGKAAKKKRDKMNKKSAISLLRAHYETSDTGLQPTAESPQIESGVNT